MAISLTTDGLSLDYKDSYQGSGNDLGPYPIGTVIATGRLPHTFSGTWAYVGGPASFSPKYGIASDIPKDSFAIRVE